MRKFNDNNVLFFPVSDSQVPEISIYTLFGNALIGGLVKPSFVPDEQFVYLPSVYESKFEKFFIEAASMHSIEFVVSQHPVVISVLARLIDQEKIDTKLISVHPQLAVELKYLSAQKVIEQIKKIFSLTKEVDTHEMMALATILEGIIGSTSVSKAWALYQLCVQTEGDLVVEIGVMFGLSAFAQSLACRVSSKKFIGIDTFDTFEAKQSESPKILSEISQVWDRKTMQAIAKNLLKLSGADFELLKADSVEAANIVSRTYPKKKISILHIDANHDYEKVRRDYYSWVPLLSDNHIIVLDDTKWSGGDGPGKFANELSQNSIYIRVIEFAGSTFFLTY